VRLSCYYHHHRHHHLYCLAFTSPNQQQTEARVFLARSSGIGHLLRQILHINSFRRAATNTATTEGIEDHQHTESDLSPLTTPLLHGFPETYPAVLISLLAPGLIHIGGEKTLSFLRLPCHNYSASQERTRNQLCRKNSLGLMTPLLKIS
jgi:hypothetical protein